MQRVQVEAPSIIAAVDLQERLQPLTAHLAGEGGEGGVAVVAEVASLQPFLRQIQNWMEQWDLSEVELRLNQGLYRLQAHSTVGWREPRDDLIEVDTTA